MNTGSTPTPIPAGLLTLLGTPDAVIDGTGHYLIEHIAAAIGCTRSCVANWFTAGRVRSAVKRANRWLIPEHVLRDWAATGLPPAGSFRRLSSTNARAGNPAPPRPETPPLARRPVDPDHDIMN